MNPACRRAAVALTVLTTTLAAGCGTGPADGGPTSTPSGSAISPTAPLTSKSSRNPSTPTTPPVPSMSAGSSSAAARTGCDFSQLGVDALRGSASAGKEFAAIIFTNTSSTTCTLAGFPGVSLRLTGQQVGSPAQRESVPTRTMTLTPGASVQASLSSIVSCNAPLSDTVRIYPPDSTEFVDKPLDMRACTLIIGPVGPPD